MNETRKRVLNALNESDGARSGPDLADELGVSRAAVWKQIEALREEGFEIESTDTGYRLRTVPDRGQSALELGLDAPFTIEYHEEIDSTNRRARELAEAGESDVVVVADTQTEGRGRLDRKWESPPGGVYLSILCRPDLSPAQAPLYTLAAAVATTRAARETGTDARIKWPNDVLVVEEDGETRKLAGILTEMQGETDRIAWIAVGIGVNLDEPEVEGSTGLRSHTKTVDSTAFIQRILEEFDALRSDPDSIIPAWREYAITIGERIRVKTEREEFVGQAVAIESPGTLLIKTVGGTVRVNAGDCEHLRPEE